MRKDLKYIMKKLTITILNLLKICSYSALHFVMCPLTNLKGKKYKIVSFKDRLQLAKHFLPLQISVWSKIKISFVIRDLNLKIVNS